MDYLFKGRFSIWKLDKTSNTEKEEKKFYDYWIPIKSFDLLSFDKKKIDNSEIVWCVVCTVCTQVSERYYQKNKIRNSLVANRSVF